MKTISRNLLLLAMILLLAAGCATEHKSPRLARIYMAGAIVRDPITVKVRYKGLFYEKPDHLKSDGFVFVVTEPGEYFGKEIRYGNFWKSLDALKLVIGREYLVTLSRKEIGVDELLCDSGLELER